MASKTPSHVLCSTCERPGSPDEVKCSHCGGRVVRVCGACGFKNSAAKNYCDVCGEEMKLGPAPPPPKPKEPPKRLTPPPVRREEVPPSPGLEDRIKSRREELQRAIPKTFIQRLTGASPSGPESPPERRPEPRPEPKPPARAKPPEEPPRERPKVRFTPTELQRDHERHKRREREREQERRHIEGHREPGRAARTIEPTLRRIQERPVFSTLLGLVLLVIGAGLYGYFWKTKRTPAKVLTDTVGQYLFALKQKRYSDAYALLTADSRAAGSLSDFASVQDSSVWTFDDIRVESLSEDWAFLRYKLLVSAKPVEDDWLHFRRENGEWRRVFWWHLQPKLEAVLERKDYPAALALAQNAAKINPRDPQTSAYLCEAAYFVESYPTAEAACRRSFKAAETFPSRLEAETIFHLHRIMADIYRNHMGRPKDALEEHQILLAFPSITDSEACGVSLAQGETLYAVGEFAKASEAFQAASGTCPREVDASFAARSRLILTGQAGPQAVLALKRHHMAGHDKTVFEWRDDARSELAKRLKTNPNAIPKETWTPIFVSGSLYKVSLRDDVNEILSATVDLWTHDIKVDIHVQ